MAFSGSSLRSRTARSQPRRYATTEAGFSCTILFVAVSMNGITSYRQKSSSGRMRPSCSAMATKGSPSAAMSTAFATMLGTRSLASGMFAIWKSLALRPWAGATLDTKMNSVMVPLGRPMRLPLSCATVLMSDDLRTTRWFEPQKSELTPIAT